MKPHVTKALACSMAAFAAAVGVFYLAFGSPPADRAGEAVGRLLALTATAGVACGWVAARSAHAWSWFKFVAVYAGFCVALLLVAAYGKSTHAGEPQAPPGSPLAIVWPAGWTVQHLSGASSDPADRDLGSRERGLLGDTAAPTAVIEIGCVRRDRAARLDAEFKGIFAGAADGYRRQGFEVTETKPSPTHIGKQDGLGAVLYATQGGVELMQDFSLAPGPACLLVSTLTARKAAFYENLAAYAAVKASVH